MKDTILAVLAFVSVLGAQYPPSTNARSLQGRRISSTAPNDAEVLTYLSATGQWTPTVLGRGGLDGVTGASVLTAASVIPRVSAAGVLGPSKLYDYGSTNPVQVEGTNFEVLNRSVLGSESLNETGFATHANWDVTGDMDDTGGAAVYTDATHAGTLVQTAANLAVALVANRHYVFTYTVSGKSGDPACTIDTTAAAATQYGSETRSLTLTNGAQTTYFKSAGTVTDFGISCTSTSGGVTLDDVSLKEVQGGNVVANGSVSANNVKNLSGQTLIDGWLRRAYFDTLESHAPGDPLELAYGQANTPVIVHFGNFLGILPSGTPDRTLHAEYDLATSGTTGYVQRLTRTCAGAGGCAANDGAGLEFELETATGSTNHIAASIEAKWTTATAGSEDGRIEFYTTRAGTETLAATITKGGDLAVVKSLGVGTPPTGVSGRISAAEGVYAAASGEMGWTSRSLMTSPTSGNILLTNHLGADFGLLQLGGTTSSFPALKRNAAGVQIRVADDSAYGALDALSYAVGGVAGYNGAISVRKGDDSGACTITVTNGIVTATTC